LNEIADEEEREAAWVEWVKDQLPKTKSVDTRPAPTEWEKRDMELRKSNPIYADIADQLKGPSYAPSMFDGFFLPTHKGYH